MNTSSLLALGLYLSILGLISFLAFRKSKKNGDFILGARSLSYWVTALAAHASDMSAFLFMVLPAAIYSRGLIEAWMAIGLTFFMFLNWRFVAPRLRVLTERYQSVTLSSFFEKRFKDTSGMLRIVSAFFCLLFFMFYISANFVALGHLSESIFGIGYLSGILIGGLIVFGILLGGYLSIAWIDFFQGMFLLLMIIFVPIVAFFNIGGLAEIFDIAKSKGISLHFFPDFSWGRLGEIIMIIGGWGLGYFGMPHIITKFMGIRDVEDMKKAMRVGLSWQAIALVASVAVGVVGIAYFPRGLANNELIFVAMTKSLFSSFFSTFILCAVLAAAINVLGAQVLVSASVLAEDFYKSFIKEKNTVKAHNKVQLASRVSVLVVCSFAFVVACLSRQKTIYELIYYAWAGLGCSFGPLVLVSLHSNLQNRYAALAGILVGGLTAGIWPYFNSSILVMIPGFIASFLGMAAVVGLSYLKRRFG